MKNVFQILSLLTIVYFFTGCSSATVNSFEKEDVTFYSRDTKLAGTIVFPKEELIHSVVVVVHGSGRVTKFIELAEKFAADGIAALVYDKRGVGMSAGTFIDGYCTEPCLDVLADDAVAAIEYISNHKKLRNIPVGLTGISQAGWIVPIAAVRTAKVNFIALWSGPVCKMSEEDIYSQYTSDRDFDSLPSYENILQMRREPYTWDEKFGKNIDANESLRQMNIPGFWIFGLNDGSIPVDISIANLKKLKEEGKSTFDYVSFSGLGHALINETFATMCTWIKSNANGRNLPAKPLQLSKQDYQNYTGKYICNDLQIEMTIAIQNGKLVIIFPSGSAEITFIGANSFYYHDYGVGYGWLDFDLNADTLMINQTGKSYTFKKVN